MLPKIYNTILITTIIAFFLSLSDDTQEIQQEIQEKFVLCGKQYYDENEKELQKLQLIEEELPCFNYLSKVSIKRPTLGCRALVQRNIRVINIVITELNDWKEEVRLHSLKLLWQIVLHSEKAVSCKYPDLMLALSKCFQNDESTVLTKAKHVSVLLGQLLDYDEWIHYTLKELERNPTSIGVLRCFTYTFNGAATACKYKDISSITKMLIGSSVCFNWSVSVQYVLLTLIEELISLYLLQLSELDAEVKECDSSFRTLEQDLFEILITVITLSNIHKDNKIEIYGTKLLDKLANYQSKTNLYEKYLEKIIISIEDLECEHSDRSERISILYGCIQLCGFQKSYFNSMKRAIKQILENSSADAQVKILTAISIVGTGCFIQCSYKILIDYLIKILSGNA